MFARPIGGDYSYHPAPKTLTAFPDATRAKQMSSVQGGGKKRSRWKDRKGRIYEWDYENGRIELYDKQGKHLGEFNPIQENVQRLLNQGEPHQSDIGEQ